jgi:hypothetical protein
MNLEIAKQIAEKAHAGQKRKNGEDYINHCIRVSNMAAEYSEEAAIVGMLHDVIEDSDMSVPRLMDYGFNSLIAGAVACLTRGGESYLEYILSIKECGWSSKMGRLTIPTKICDLTDNLNGATGTLRDKYMMAYYILTGEVYAPHS